jgi:hypothetical protein
MPVAPSAKRWLAPAAKTLAPRLFWRRKYGILQRLGAARPDVQLVASLCDPNRVPRGCGPGSRVRQLTIAPGAVTAGLPAVSQGHESRESRRQQ